MKGSCLCKAIEYEVVKLNSPIMHCSCYSCRKAHSAAFNTAAAVLKEDFRWVKGESELTAYESSPGKLRYFCSHCGSQLAAIREETPVVIVRVATLDDDPRVTPSVQIWKSHEVPWLARRDDLPAYPEWQPGR